MIGARASWPAHTGQRPCTGLHPQTAPKKVSNSINIPVIASGGVGKLDHLYDGIVKGGASAVLAASIFHYGEFTIKDTKEYLKSKNIPVRL